MLKLEERLGSSGIDCRPIWDRWEEGARLMEGVRTFGPGAHPTTLRVNDGLLPIDHYADRNGYDPAFITGVGAIPLPVPGDRFAGDVAELVPEGRVDHSDPYELKYRNFSVYMCRSRRLPIFSAVNIDGSKSVRGLKRTNVWRKDPRLDPAMQITREIYGEENKGFFSRGHMTRREDPNWGDDERLLQQADADTFHATNAAPQRQSFNGVIWLGLEDYVLSHADQSDMRITVITGPILADDDPVYFGIKTPVTFWKVIAFRHERTGRLTAIGYSRSQAQQLPNRISARFVFSQFNDMQVSIASLAADAGLDFGILAKADVMADAPQMAVRLQSLEDIYLHK